MAASRRKSFVWQHFTISATDDSKAVCNQCGDEISRGGKNRKSFNTTNLCKHLESLHPVLFTQLLKEEQDSARLTKVPANQPTLKGIVEAKDF